MALSECVDGWVGGRVNGRMDTDRHRDENSQPFSIRKICRLYKIQEYKKLYLKSAFNYNISKH